MQDDDFRQREAFLAVVRAGSFSAGARALGRDVSVISRRIAALEKRLGIRLIERTTRRIRPTEEGRRYRQKIELADELLREAEEEARALAARPAGTIRLTVPASFGRRWVAQALPGFLKAYPDIRIVLHCSDRYVDLLGDNFDMAIRIGVLTDNRLIARKLADTSRILCVAPSYLDHHPALTHPQDLRKHDCLGFTPMHSWPEWRLEKEGQQIAVPVQTRYESDEMDALILAAQFGMGVALAANWLVQKELAEGTLVPVLTDWQAIGEDGVWLMKPSSQLQSAKISALTEWLVEWFAVPRW
ncbi:transcriptional regulator, LysR family [Candidatus Pantoea symbiotica]|jgi:DNA-binding transcriptional LysR family regulator|uniref:Transcriptional regulator, LysR family n=1 Tax=Candidatus Pantoea symbiotica TaxID=1884370 RepID=A0A1I4D6B6_9GAMM|nr:MULTISPECIES: LysR family transcriptional regulator [Pantoea]KAJ9429924.1 LysR family transcriptional regulator [Pantoea sp. YR343]MRT25528.1 LysR family transcriptional regulator [Enterobacteriaceae bacterium RIT697]SFK87521.1 transcriptional regulator, LysR family [Pantoea symbiotica]SFV04284.1 transcriptional regulator, LysR family [Pantoea sp. YR525]